MGCASAKCRRRNPCARPKPMCCTTVQTTQCCCPEPEPCVIEVPVPVPVRVPVRVPVPVKVPVPVAVPVKCCQVRTRCYKEVCC